ncbi:MAG: hypothetical protein WD534_18725 [Phycisphaeraceae bacterium]
MKAATTTALMLLGLMYGTTRIASADTDTAPSDTDREPAHTLITNEIRLLIVEPAEFDRLAEATQDDLGFDLADAAGGVWLDEFEVNFIVHTAIASNRSLSFIAPRISVRSGETAQATFRKPPHFVGIELESEEPKPPFPADLRLTTELADADDSEGGLRTVASLTLHDTIEPELTGDETVTAAMSSQYRWAWRGQTDRTLLLELPADSELVKQILTHLDPDDAGPSRVLLLVRQQAIESDDTEALQFPRLLDHSAEDDRPPWR